ncbi:MAG TPA: transcription termination factor NusA [Chthonomonadaceae bacterium]|nr:transcription termination factor NusA [Chthonomonadaceae bacterium]
MNGEFIDALQQISKEKDIPLDTLIDTVSSALETAYKKNYPANTEIRVTINTQKTAASQFRVFTERTIVEGPTEEPSEITLEEARRIDPEKMLGETIEEDIDQKNFGRIAAQTAKQVVVQRIREAERRKIFDEYNEKVGEVVTGVVQRHEGRNILVSLGKLDALLPIQEQVETEPYHFNDRIKVYVLEVKETPKGPQVIVSRTHPSLIRRLFELEVPEIADGVVTIKSVAREPGARSKIAVTSRDEKVDPVGACVGHRGSRVQAVVNELYDEKIDIVRWNADTSLFIGEALSPAKAVKVTAKEDDKSAFVIVPDNQLSLAIGKAGQNVRLAARLTGWRIDIRSEAQMARAALMAMTAQLGEDDDAAGSAEADGEPGGEEAAAEAGPIGQKEETMAAASDTIGDVAPYSEEDIPSLPADTAAAGNGHQPEETAPEATGSEEEPVVHAASADSSVE